MHLPRWSNLFLLSAATLGVSCVGSITDYDTLEVTAHRADFDGGSDSVAFAFTTKDDGCISTPDLEADVDDVSDDIDGGGGNPCRPPRGSIEAILDAGQHRLTIDEGEHDVAVRFTLPQRPFFADGATIVQGKTVVLRGAVHRAPDRIKASVRLAGADPIDLSPLVEGDDVRLPIPDDLVSGDPVDAAISVTISYRGEDIDDLDDIDDCDFDIVDDIGVAVRVREPNLLDDLLDIILGG